MKLQRRITSAVTAVHEHIVFAIVAVKVTVQSYLRLSHQPGEIRHDKEQNEEFCAEQMVACQNKREI